MRKLAMIFPFAILLACNSANKSEFKPPETNPNDSQSLTGNVPKGQYDPNRGIGKYTADNLKIEPYLNEKMATDGEDIFKQKCANCHKTTDEKLVGPGWKGITQRRTSHWIMNYIMDPHPMLNADPNLKVLVDSLKVVMPNVGLNDYQARNVLEFMRKNDGVKPQ